MNNNSGKKRSYTISFKLEVISYAESTSNRNASIYYKIDRKRVQEWRKQKSELEAIKNNPNLNSDHVRVLEGRGRKAMYPMLEEELIKFIKNMREEGNAITTFIIEKKAKELGKSLASDNFKASHGWIERFKHRHNLVQRVRTQVAQKLPEDMPSTVKDFLQYSREKTKNIEKKFIITFDETPMWFDMPRNSTIDFYGVREVPIKTTGNDKLRFTIVLGYTASGEKLPATVIFKLAKVPKCKFPKDIIVTTATHANMHGDLMLATYIPQAIRARPGRFFKNKGIIFVDCHGSHIREDVMKALSLEGLTVIKIPVEQLVFYNHQMFQ